MVKILGSCWFSPGGSLQIIGIVKTINEMNEIKYYIGCANGDNQKEDEIHISEWGSTFPKEAGEKLI